MAKKKTSRTTSRKPARKPARKAARKAPARKPAARKATAPAKAAKAKTRAKAPVRKAKPAPKRKPAARPRAVAKPKAVRKPKPAAKPKAVAKPKAMAKPKAAPKPKAKAAPKPNVAAKLKAPVAPAARPPAGLNRERKRLAEVEAAGFTGVGADERMLSAARAGHDELRSELRKHTEAGPELTAGDVDAKWQDAYAVGDEAPGGDNPTPDQDRVDDIGKALGVEYDDDEELMGGEEITERDEHRWELDPASKEDDEEF